MKKKIKNLNLLLGVFLLFSFKQGLQLNVQPTSDINFNTLDYDSSQINDVNDHFDEILDGVNPNVSYSSNYYSYDDFKSAYFDNLTYNFGMNYKGSCGYVAMGMLLSYYDTFANDNIIYDAYDVNTVSTSYDFISHRNSPGIIKDVIFGDMNHNPDEGYYLDSVEYYNKMDSYQNMSFHSKLIIKAALLGYYNFEDNVNPCGSNFNMRKDVLEYYLDSNNLKYTLNYKNDGEYNEALSEETRKYTINQIKDGHPVMLSIGRKGQSGGHVVVAYDYDETSDKIYCHMGWNARSTHATIENYGYDWYKTALTIHFDDPHSHSNNYGVSREINGSSRIYYYCYDSKQILTYDPSSFSEVITYELLNANSHIKISNLGSYSVEVHSFKPAAQNRVVCKHCGYTKSTLSGGGIVLANYNHSREDFN